MPSTTILEEIEAEKTAQQRLRHLSSVSSLPSADLAFIDGFWERHLADMPGRDGYPEGCLLLLDDVRAVLSGSVGALPDVNFADLAAVIGVLVLGEHDVLDVVDRVRARRLALPLLVHLLGEAKGIPQVERRLADRFAPVGERREGAR